MKFTSKGGITLKAKRKGNMVQVTVKDTGLGIKPESVSKLFNEFCMLGEHRTINPNGTGLGLYLCKKFAKMMKGSIDVKSVYGKGAKFILKLPLAREEKSKGRNKGLEEHKSNAKKNTGTTTIFEIKEQEAPDTIDSNRKSSKTVLIVDDNTVNAFVVSQMVKRYNVKTEEAANGKIAIDLIKQRGFTDPYSLILTDINMPIMSGIEVILIKQLGC